MSSSQEPRINMVPDSAPWKDEDLENSDKNNYKCGLPITLNNAQGEPIQVSSKRGLQKTAKERPECPTFSHFTECDFAEEVA
ncbi:uncharacterized protein H6S33_007634 [Morchella sextelata]|uniref:uncharacterized protein n=1 Tax=Morchella sextelata TaxID=1174677 RepID=UPI001D03ABFF|nr:uncharacterized protein H6S33_007634 [Morchella sextelata]KAH0603312.1 hypothetical protein H6S33_007634 [Morchella sextelata]